MLSNMLIKIAARRLKVLTVGQEISNEIHNKALMIELGQLGFRLNNSQDLRQVNQESFTTLLSTLKEMRGGNVHYVPLFNNFPDNLPNDYSYFLARILGCFGINTFDSDQFGADPVTQRQREDLWQRAVTAQKERLQDEQTEWITLQVMSEQQTQQALKEWVLNLVYASSTIKEALWEDIFTVLASLEIPVDPKQIKIKETLARLAADIWQRREVIWGQTPTDVLRMLAFVKDQDVSLAQPIVLKGLALSKPQRRAIMQFLSRCSNLEEDLLRYKGLWISVANRLHPGDFKRQFPFVVKAFDKLRNNQIHSFESQVAQSSGLEQLTLLQERPSMLLRKITWLAKTLPAAEIAQAVASLDVSSIPLPLLLSAYCALAQTPQRLIVNKKAKPFAIAGRSHPIDPMIIQAVQQLIDTKLSQSKSWKSVWIDPAIFKLVLPLQARKQGDGLLQLGRGSRLKISDCPVIRLFVYWQQHSETTDLDLSVLKLNKKFEYAGQVSWNRYENGKDIAHSGDIQDAPDGAAEFIDLKLDKMEGDYLLPSILHFAGEKFSELNVCYGGWMNRTHCDSNYQGFDAKTVAEKITVNQSGNNWIPFMLDLKAREIVLVDLYSNGKRTIERNLQFPAIATAIADEWKYKPTYGLLATCYAQANHIPSCDRKNAEVTIGMDENCTINVLTLSGENVLSLDS